MPRLTSVGLQGSPLAACPSPNMYRLLQPQDQLQQANVRIPAKLVLLRMRQYVCAGLADSVVLSFPPLISDLWEKRRTFLANRNKDVERVTIQVSLRRSHDTRHR